MQKNVKREFVILSLFVKPFDTNMRNTVKPIYIDHQRDRDTITWLLSIGGGYSEVTDLIKMLSKGLTVC